MCVCVPPHPLPDPAFFCVEGWGACSELARWCRRCPNCTERFLGHQHQQIRRIPASAWLQESQCGTAVFSLSPPQAALISRCSIWAAPRSSATSGNTTTTMSRVSTPPPVHWMSWSTKRACLRPRPPVPRRHICRRYVRQDPYGVGEGRIGTADSEQGTPGALLLLGGGYRQSC